jgi:hypothetical protein
MDLRHAIDLIMSYIIQKLLVCVIIKLILKLFEHFNNYIITNFKFYLNLLQLPFFQFCQFCQFYAKNFILQLH